MYRNTLKGKYTGKIYYACEKNCPVCLEWKKPYNNWKTLYYFPYHCPGCYFAGMPDDFYLVGGNTFVCLECHTKYKKRLKEVLRIKSPN